MAKGTRYHYTCLACGDEIAGKGRFTEHFLENHAKMEYRLPECGTDAGYQEHRRLGEEACDPCKVAHSRYTAEWQRQWRRGYGFHHPMIGADKDRRRRKGGQR